MKSRRPLVGFALQRALFRPSLRVHLQILAAAAGLGATSALAQLTLPADVANTCAVAPSEFNGWFLSRTNSANGFVVNPNSLTFAGNNPCDFYKWSSQMFLWLTSPTSGTGGRVFDSPVFFNLSTVDPTTTNRTLIPNAQKGGLRTMVMRATKPGNVEDGQAGGGGALMSQGGSLVYYTLDVNNVFAWLVTGATNNNIIPRPTNFPSNAVQLASLVKLAGDSQSIAPSDAMAMELKTSWVDAATVDATKYITMTAQVPVFTKTPTNWTATGATANKTLAMVGMHVVGSALNHPEMIWATFEHINNSPNGQYSYLNSKQSTVTQPQDTVTVGSWNFCANGSTGPFNVEKFKAGGSGLSAISTNHIEASDTLRLNPWGGATDATNNSMIISLNRSVLGQLASSDVRRNYLLMGATWTTGSVPTSGTDTNSVRGSLLLGNSTMETYTQTNAPNCFSCHNNSPLLASGLSHVFYQILPLLKPSAANASRKP